MFCCDDRNATQTEPGSLPDTTFFGAKPIKAMTYAYEIDCKGDQGGAEEAGPEPNTRHYVHRWVIDEGEGKLALLPPVLKGQAATVPALFDAAAAKFPNNPCMAYRQIEECVYRKDEKSGRTFMSWTKGPYIPISYKDVQTSVHNAAKGLRGLKNVVQDSVVALLATTSHEWMIGAQASLKAGLSITTVYDTLGHDAMLYGLKQTKAKVIFVDNENYSTLLEPVLSKCEDIEHIVLIGKVFEPLKTTGGESKAFPTDEAAEAMPAVGNAATMTLTGLEKRGKDSDVDFAAVAPTEDDIAIIMYTSGSTGNPKGVELTHKNFISMMGAVEAQQQINTAPDDIYVAYLPLAHIFELICEVGTFAGGGQIGYAHARTLTSASPYIARGDTTSPDLATLRPTKMAAVPAILDLIYKGVTAKTQAPEGASFGERTQAGMLEGAINRAVGTTSGWHPAGLADGIVLGKVRATAGLDRCKVLISGGAPLSATTQDFIQAVFGIPVAQGYGATETCAGSTVQQIYARKGMPADNGSGRVGAIQPCTEIKLRSVPEMGYLVNGKDVDGNAKVAGEILVSGNNVAKGYFVGGTAEERAELEKKNAEDFRSHPDGKVWFHTGDIGEMDADGVMKIVDRKKDLVKLSGGEYVSLGKVESMLKAVPGITSCVVFAKSDMTYCCCVVSQPEQGWKGAREQMGSNEDLALAISKELSSKKLAKFEIPTKVTVVDDIWTPETGLVTAALKVNRNNLRSKYAGNGVLSKMGYEFPQ